MILTSQTKQQKEKRTLLGKHSRFTQRKRIFGEENKRKEKTSTYIFHQKADSSCLHIAKAKVAYDE